MADDDDDLNDFKVPPDTNEDADAQLDKKALGMVKEYVASLARSANENETRANIRENIVKLGINSLSFQHELTAQKVMDAADRRDYMAGRKRMARIFAQEAGLFAAEQEEVKKRKARKLDKETRRKAEAAAAKAKSIEAGDDNPRSDPERGGAKPRTGKKGSKTPAQVMKEGAAKSDALLADAIADAESTSAQRARITELEQSAGDTVLKDLAPNTLGDKPKSQSQIAAEKLEESGANR